MVCILSKNVQHSFALRDIEAPTSQVLSNGRKIYTGLNTSVAKYPEVLLATMLDIPDEEPYVAFPIPDNSKTLGVPTVPADTITSRSTGTLIIVPFARIYSTCTARTSPLLAEVSFDQTILLTVAFAMISKFVLFVKGVT